MSLIVRIAGISGIVLWGAACARPIQPAMSAPTPESAPEPRPVTPKPVKVRPSVTRAEIPPPNPKLPDVPEVDGPLKIRVVYPPANAIIASKDSNFIFGSIGNGFAGLRINGTLVPVWPNGAFMGWVANPSNNQQRYELIAYTATDTVRYIHPVRTRSAMPPTPGAKETIVPITPSRVVTLHNDSLARAVSDTDNVIIGRPTPTGIYQWFLFPGTVVRLTAQQGDMVRVRLDAGREIWVSRSDIAPLRATNRVASEQIEIKNASLVPQNDWIDFRIPTGQPPAYAVEQDDENTLSLIFYNTNTDPDEPLWASSSPDPYLTKAAVKRTATRVIYTFTFSRPVYGYLPLYSNGVMTFRMRRPPIVSRQYPLNGLTIAIDAGHPPAGATGPTGLYEAVPNLAIAERVRELLTSKGAKVIMTRLNDKAVPLGDRTIVARRVNADALVSIHLNAFPDGMNPFRGNGTGTYYFQPLSKRFATLVQRALVPELGLRDLGIFRSNLSLVRPTWMPSVLTEGAFLIMPDQEAALRTAEYQNAYARGVVNGLEEFFLMFSR